MMHNNSERGYTLQTLIIIAILVLGATTASVVLYAILRDTTSRVAGGSETFDGYPSGPQNLRVESVPSGSDVVVTISWEAPSYLGEFPLTGYELSVTENNSPKLETGKQPPDSPDWNCGGTGGDIVLATTDSNFTYDNSCEGTVTMVDDEADYELVFTINLGSADARSSPGGLTFYRELNLSTYAPPPDSLQVKSLHEAAEISWDAVPDIVYRLHIELTGTPDPPDYYQCFESTGGMVTREVPNFRNRSAFGSQATLLRFEKYTIKISASKPNPPGTLDDAFCSGDNFGGSVEITARFGTPPIPEMTLETESTRMVGTATLASLKATLSSCESDMRTTFYWEEAGKPETQRQQTVSGCGSTTECPCELIVYGDFDVDTEYELWAIAANDIGTSSPSPRQSWHPVGTSSLLSPAAPDNVDAFSTDTGIVISWDSPEFIPEEAFNGYKLSWLAKPPAGCPETTLSNTISFSPTTHQYTFSPSGLTFGTTYCFQLRAYSSYNGAVTRDSSPVNFEATHIDQFASGLSLGVEEFLFHWRTYSKARYYTIRWAPFPENLACSHVISISNTQPSSYFRVTFPYTGEEILNYSIPVTKNLFYNVVVEMTLADGETFSLSRDYCTNLTQTPEITSLQWQSNGGGILAATEGTPIEITWVVGDNADSRYGPYSYALRLRGAITSPATCIPFNDSRLTEIVTEVAGVTVRRVSYRITDSAVLPSNYFYDLNIAPSVDCTSSTDASRIITGTDPDGVPPPDPDPLHSLTKGSIHVIAAP